MPVKPNLEYDDENDDDEVSVMDDGLHRHETDGFKVNFFNNKSSQTCFCADKNKLNESHHPQTSPVFHNATPLQDLQEEGEDLGANHAVHYQRKPEERFDSTDMKPSLPQPNPNDQIRVLRDLLRLERGHNERRRRNNTAMKEYIRNLQTDFLRQQRELVEALEFCNKLKDQKDSQMQILEATIVEKDRLIGNLRSQLNDLDESKIRARFNETLDKQQGLAKIQTEQLQSQIVQLEQQVDNEKKINSQLTLKNQESLANLSRQYEQELTLSRKRIKELQTEIEELLNSPQNLVIRTLKEKNLELDNQLAVMNSLLNESKSKYDSINCKVEEMLSEHEQAESKYREENEKLVTLYNDQRQFIQKLTFEQQDKQELIQVLQFNLQRSEKRVQSLIGILKNKEETYKKLLDSVETKNLEEFGKVNIEFNLIQKQLVENAAELKKKQNELIALKLDHDNQLESLRNDRDERLSRSNLEKQKIEKELQQTEMKLASELESANLKAKQTDQLQKDVAQFKDESKRLLIELTKSEAKLYAKQKELDDIYQKHKALSEMEGAGNPESAQNLKLELEEEKRISTRYKNQLDGLKKDHEKMCMKLRIAETNLIKMTSSINREHARMLRDYEKKIEQIRSEQVVFDRNKIRYKRYGFKLKKYCEHLKKIHNHICNPDTCGYLFNSTSNCSLKMGSEIEGGSNRPIRCSHKGSDNDEEYLSFGEDKDCDPLKGGTSDSFYSGAENASSIGRPEIEPLSDGCDDRRKYDCNIGAPKGKFRIKRTGNSSTGNVSGMNTSQISSRCGEIKEKSPKQYTHTNGTHYLKPSDKNASSTGRKEIKRVQQDDHQHDYCYIDEDSFTYG